MTCPISGRRVVPGLLTFGLGANHSILITTFYSLFGCDVSITYGDAPAPIHKVTTITITFQGKTW